MSVNFVCNYVQNQFTLNASICVQSTTVKEIGVKSASVCSGGCFCASETNMIYRIRQLRGTCPSWSELL